VVDSSRDEQTRAVVEAQSAALPLRYERAIEPSAAKQRNQGARQVTTPLVAFIDDDARLFPDTCEKLCRVFDEDPTGAIGGVAGRLTGTPRPVPRGLLWYYYRLQAGYAHATYGGKLLGPAVNCYPSYTETDGELIPADWLSSTCVFYRTTAFQAELFPSFSGYSFMEDVHLSARIARKHQVFFHRSALFEHDDAPSSWKRDLAALARSRIRNQRMVAREVMGFSGPLFELKLLLHRLFVTVYLLRQRGEGTWKEITGTWT
jgi:cellulose synthase/poly-beta-1,6-N-acetylglucosamine synthase-like glycosyltransferase